MTTVQEARKSWQVQYVNAYIYRRLSSTEWETTPIDVSRDVLEDKIQQISYSLDPYAFDVGLFFSSKFTVTLDNSRGKFSDVNNSRSIWSGFLTRDNSIFKLECGYVSDDGDEVENIAFEGLIKSSTVEEDGDVDNIMFDVYGFENIFNDINIQSGSLAAGTVSSIIYQMLNTPEITEIIDIDALNISPDNDFMITVPSALSGRPIKEALTDLLIAANSVAYIDSDRVFHCTSRAESDEVAVQLTSNSQRGLTDNISSIKKYSGEARVFNVFQTSDGEQTSFASTDVLQAYGVKYKSITVDFVSDETVIQGILDRLVTEFQYPKEEYEVETDYLGDAIGLLDKVYLEVFPEFIDTGSDLPVCGIAVCGEAILTDYNGGMIITGDKLFKVLKITHNVRTMTSTLYIRNVGVNLSDGFAGSDGVLAVCGFAICGVGGI